MAEDTAWLLSRNRAGRTLGLTVFGVYRGGCGWGELSPLHAAPWLAAPPPPPVPLPARLGPSGFHQVSQQSGCDIMRQAGVSGVTSRGPDVWKSPNQNDPTDKPETGFSKGLLQLPRDRETGAGAARPFPSLLSSDGKAAGPRDHLGSRVGGVPSLRLPEAHFSWGGGPPHRSRCEQGCLGRPHTRDKEHWTRSEPVPAVGTRRAARGPGVQGGCWGGTHGTMGRGCRSHSMPPHPQVQPYVSKPDSHSKPSLQVLTWGKKILFKLHAEVFKLLKI